MAPSPAWEAPPDLRSQLETLWRRKWVFLACVVLIPIAVYVWSARQPNLYQSSVLLQVQAQAVDTSLFSGQAETSTEVLNTVARLTQTTAMARVAARRLRPRPSDPRELLGHISASPEEESGFITITAGDTDPRRAAAIANAFGSAVQRTRADKARAQIGPAIEGIKRNLDQLAPNDNAGRTQLSQQLQRLRALYAAQGKNAQIVERAVVSDVPVSPRPLRNAALAFVLALLIGIGAAFLVEVLDRRIRDVEELERIAGVPLLGIVPLSGLDGSRLTAEAAEAFQTLRASLTYFNVDRPLTSVVVCSPLKGDGKTTVATNLARALARAGRQVTVVDTDMRRPQVDVRMGTRADVGLGDVLVDKCSLREALITLDLEVEVENGGVRMLPSGPPPPNPSALIASDRMRALLIELIAWPTEIVIIDTPPALQVADALPLFDQVSGVVVIARLGKTTREAMRRLIAVIKEAGGSPLGVVATSSKDGGLYGYGAYGGYGSDWAPRNGPPTDEAVVSMDRRRFSGRRSKADAIAEGNQAVDGRDNGQKRDPPAADEAHRRPSVDAT